MAELKIIITADNRSRRDISDASSDINILGNNARNSGIQIGNLNITLNNTSHSARNAAAGLASTDNALSGLQRRFDLFLKLQVSQFFTRQVGEIISASDAYRGLDARLQIVSDNTKEYGVAQNEIFAIAQRNRTELEATTKVYGKLETAVKNLGGTQQLAIQTTDTIAKAITLSGGSAATAKAGLEQFNQGLGSGVLRGEEFNSVMENTPRLALALADGLGIPIGKLRSMAEEGKLTADVLINALGKSAPKIAAEFEKLPLTVSGSLTTLNNAWLKYIGNSETANSSTAKLADVVVFLSKNLDGAVNVVTAIGTALLGKYVAGLVQSSQATAAARFQTAQLLQAQAAELTATRAQIQADIASIESRLAIARANETMALSTYRAAQGTNAAMQATLGYGAALNRVTAIEAELTAANARMAATMPVAAASVGVLSRAIGVLGAVLNAAFIGFIAYDLAKPVVEWATQFEAFRIVQIRLAETFVILKTGIEGFFTGISALERFQQLQRIHEEFNQMAADAKKGNEQQAKSEDDKAAAIESAALKQQQAFDKVKEATKSLTAQIDTEAKTQTAAIQQSLDDRLAAVDSSIVADIEKEKQRVQAKLEASQQEVLLQKTVSEEKLLLIDAEYAKELQQAASNKDRLNSIEFEKKQAKLSVYQGLADFYAGEVARLSSVYATENQLAATAQQQLRDLAKKHQFELTDIERIGLSDREKVAKQEYEFSDILYKLNAAKKKGDQESVNALLERAKTLHGEITTSAINGAKSQEERSSKVYQAQERANKLYGEEKEALEKSAKAHEDNAAAATKSLEGVKEKLTEVNKLIAEINQAIGKELQVKIGFDEKSFNDLKSKIADLVKPETKTITINTVQGGSAAPKADVPLKFSVGGFAKKEGFLPGFGGGDRIQALLEAGEFIVRKEAVKGLGLPFLQAINQGKLPVEPIRRSEGGLVGDESGSGLQEMLYKLKLLVDKKKEIQAAYERAQRLKLSGFGEQYNRDYLAASNNVFATDGKVSEAINALLSKIYSETGNRVKVIGASNTSGLNTSVASRFNVDSFLNGKKITLPDSFSVDRAMAPVSRFNDSVASVGAKSAETINVNFNVNGKSAMGHFNKSASTMQLLDELRLSGVVTG